jgi:hypothetical protein
MLLPQPMCEGSQYFTEWTEKSGLHAANLPYTMQIAGDEAGRDVRTGGMSYRIHQL